MLSLGVVVSMQEKHACKICLKCRKQCIRKTFSNTHEPLWEKKSHIVRSYIVTTEFKNSIRARKMVEWIIFAALVEDLKSVSST